VDPALFDSILKTGSANLSRVNLLTRKNELVASNGVAQTASSAQSKQEPSWFEKIVMQLTNVADAKLALASAPVPASEMRIETRIDDTGRHSAWILFLILAITPLALLGLVYIVYARAIARDVMYWIYGVKNAALERIANPASTRMARVSPSMPRELARVAEAFNNMLTDLSAREGALKASIVENEFLTRELHHRVKNSLQVIQSYLSLSERLQKGPPNSEVQATTARVQVLSIAYRLALADGRMRPIPIDLFAEEVVSSSMASLRKTGQWISVEALTHGVLSVDRAIPFGLAIVEAVLAGLRANGTSMLRVVVQPTDKGALNLIVEGDAPPCPDDPNPKILRGLSLQLEAQVLQPEGDQIINWVFST
jgi:two-component sensor histidine kinase